MHHPSCPSAETALPPADRGSVTVEIARPPADRGSVTAETAVVLPVLLVVLSMLVWVLACLSAQLSCVDAARSAARLAARGEPPAVVSAAAREVGPDGAVVVSGGDDDHVTIEVRALVRPWGTALRLPAVPVSARATAVRELSSTLGPPS